MCIYMYMYVWCMYTMCIRHVHVSSSFAILLITIIFSKVAALQVLMSQVLTLINSTLKVGQVINDMVSFEASLSSVSALVCVVELIIMEVALLSVNQIFVPDDSLTPNLTYNVMTVEQLQEMWPYVSAFTGSKLRCAVHV